MVKKNISNEALRELEFESRAVMEAQARRLDAAILKAYKNAQLNIANRIQLFNNRYPRGSNFELGSTQIAFKSMRADINKEIVALSNSVESATAKEMAIGVDKAEAVVAESRALIEAEGLSWGAYLATNIESYIESGLLLEQYPASVKTYSDLLTHFDRTKYQAFKEMDFLPGFDARFTKSRAEGTLLNVGDIDRLTQMTWSPIGELRQIFRSADFQRLSYSQLVTILRQDVWNLRPGARNPRITYQATRLARTEMARTAALAQNSWGWETPGIVGVRRWFGGGACDGSCLQYVGLWLFDRHGHPAAIPIHPHCGCYETFETSSTAGQHSQEVMLLSDGRYMDSMTYRHDLELAARVDLDDAFPNIVQRYTLQGSDEFYRPLGRGSALANNIRSRLEEIN